jgi:cytochrome c-type biogenesis protein CcmH/NrfF
MVELNLRALTNIIESMQGTPDAQIIDHITESKGEYILYVMNRVV